MTASDDKRVENFSKFVSWCNAHIKGDEKGDAQIFLDHLFTAFGWPDGLKEAGAACEERVKKDNGGTAFADMVWKPVVLIEMKKRGEDLGKHYRQAFDYWTRLVPNRPRYVVLCNFDEFWVYDFETQMDSPVDALKLVELPDRFGPLAFLFKVPQKPVFNDSHEQVTRAAADLLSLLFNELTKRGVDRIRAQRFVLQSLMALFAQNIGLLDQYFFTRLLDDCKSRSDSFDLIGGLFLEMNTPGRTEGGRYAGVDYFNGGLFRDPARLELEAKEIDLLKNAARFDWSKVRPEIFGTLFEHSMGNEERHAMGAHFTHPTDIMKIVGPTIVEPWRQEIERAETLKRLRELLARIEQFTVLDPACGSGNFLYIAYRELKRLEAMIYKRMAGEFKSVDPTQRPFGFVSTKNFYGMDINPFAVELAKVTMMLAHKLAIDELHITERALPLDNLDSNFTVGDALINPDGSRTDWPKTSVIIGNPPFLGAKRLKPERGSDYVNALRRAYPDIPGMSDYCVYWFRRANEELVECSVNDHFVGRAGLVGTQNIRNNTSRVAGLDVICRSGGVVEAVDNQPWSGEANVHVSIANWVKTSDISLLPKNRRLWFQNQEPKGDTHACGVGRADKLYDLTFRDVSYINSALSDDTDMSGAVSLTSNKKPKRCFQGKIPGYDGFVIDKKLFDLYSKDSAAVIKPYLTGRELLDEFSISRWLIDFEQRDMVEAACFTSAFKHCESFVLPNVRETIERERTAKSDMLSAREEHLERWWQLWNRRDELTIKLATMKRYIGCSRVTRRPVMCFISAGVCPSDLVQVFAFEDDYSFGILQSGLHFELFRKSSRLKVETDTRYSVREVFEKFPWPQSPTQKQVDAVAKAARDVRNVRQSVEGSMSGGLRGLYRTLELPGKSTLRDAHAELDSAVLSVYGFSAKRDLLAQLLHLNADVAERTAKGEVVTLPGIPESYSSPVSLLSTDCLGS